MKPLLQKIVSFHNRLTLKITNNSTYKKIVKLNGTIINDYSKCNYCKACENKCPMNAINITNFQWQINNDKCVRCSKCIKVCPQKSLSMKKKS